MKKVKPVHPAPVMHARKIGGRWMGAKVKVDHKAIVDAIRADREERDEPGIDRLMRDQDLSQESKK